MMMKINKKMNLAVGEEQQMMNIQNQNISEKIFALEQELELMRRRVEKARKKQHRLIAEVRFLRQRHKLLTRNPPIGVPVTKRKITQNEQNASEIAILKHSANFDLNQAFLPEEAGGGFGDEDVKMKKKSKMMSGSRDIGPVSNMKVPICRNIGNRSNRPVKRVTWRDLVS